jgi:FkbM family methyltransferase
MNALLVRFPRVTAWLVYIKAWLVAFMHFAAPVRLSYSQAGEDRLVEDILGDLAFRDQIYVDVGANHPTRLSNSYRFYRRGWRGVTIEPNRGLLLLHAWVRPADVRLAIGCGSVPDVLKFCHANSHVLSGFENPGSKATGILGGEWMPVLPLDVVLEGVGVQPIFLLSIDVEGFDLEVARGAVRSLARTRVVVIEGATEDAALMGFFREQGFEMVASTVHNLIFHKNDVS